MAGLEREKRKKGKETKGKRRSEEMRKGGTRPRGREGLCGSA